MACTARAGAAADNARPPCVVFCDGLSTLAALVGDARIGGGPNDAAGAQPSGTPLGSGAIGGSRGSADRQWTAFMHYMVQLAQVRAHAVHQTGMSSASQPPEG